MIWNHEIPLLLKSGFRVIAYELRGHYRTKMDKKKDYTMQDLVNDLTLLLEHLKVRRCTLVGHSIGGIIASMYAANHPSKVDAIILINSSLKKIRDKDLEKHFRTRQMASTEGMSALAEYKLKRFDESRDLFKEKEQSDHFREVFTKTSIEGFVAATLALYTIPDGITEKLRACHCKVLGIVGSEDDVFMRLLKETKQEMPELKLRIIEQSDHWLVIEKPKAMYDILMEFLQEVIPKKP